MKNKLLISYVALISSALLVNLTEVEASTTSQETSENIITFVGGGGDITGPVNPEDPDLPIVIDPADPNNPGTDNPGPLSLDFVSNIQFGEKKVSGKDQVYSALNKAPYVQVTDVRGTNVGWSLSVTASEFVATNDSTEVLKGAELSFKNPTVKAASKGNISTPPTSNDVTLLNTETQTVMNANVNQGSGTWLTTWTTGTDSNDNVQLKVYAGSAKANTTYTADLKWALSDAPK